MFTDFFDAYHYLKEHKLFQDHFQECLDIEVVKVNPKTKSVDDNMALNTETRIWLETGQYSKYACWHDIELDCGGATFEEAIINLANLVKEKYGDDYEWKEAGPLW